MLTGSQGLIENQIKNWVRQMVVAVDKENGRCKKLVLRQLNVDKKPQADVHSVNLAADPSMEGTEVADRVILEIARSAQLDANDLGSGVQTYAVYAYFTNNPQYVPRKVFRVAAEEEMEREAGPSEPPSEKGLTSQLMRHLEVVSKNSLVSMGYIIQTFQKEIQQQREMNRHFLSQQIESSLLVQDVLNDASKRRIEEKQSEMATSMLEGTFEHLKVGLPILFNRLAGKEVFPPKMDRELYMLASLLENLSPDQQNALQTMLKPEQLAMLAELLGMYEQRKEKFSGKQNGNDEEAPQVEGKKPSKSLSEGGTPGLNNKLLTLFEKRRNLVNSESATEVDDARARRIEDKAKAIRDRLKAVGDIMKSSDPDKS